MIGLIGVAPFLLVHLPIMVLAASIGIASTTRQAVGSYVAKRHRLDYR
jgi:hypothetical protein